MSREGKLENNDDFIERRFPNAVSGRPGCRPVLPAFYRLESPGSDPFYNADSIMIQACKK